METDPTPFQKTIVAHARAWVGTPYLHQATKRGVGTDCLGLIRGVWREVIGAEPVEIPPYSYDWSEAAQQELLWQSAEKLLVPRPIDQAQPGDVLLFRMRHGSVAKHLGILGQSGLEASFIHAYSGHGVVENHLSSPWARRIVAVFAFPERTV